MRVFPPVVCFLVIEYAIISLVPCSYKYAVNVWHRVSGKRTFIIGLPSLVQFGKPSDQPVQLYSSQGAGSCHCIRAGGLSLLVSRGPIRNLAVQKTTCSLRVCDSGSRGYFLRGWRMNGGYTTMELVGQIERTHVISK